MTRKALGRGLNALFSDSSTKTAPTAAPAPETAVEELVELDIDLIEPNP